MNTKAESTAIERLGKSADAIAKIAVVAVAVMGVLAAAYGDARWARADDVKAVVSSHDIRIDTVNKRVTMVEKTNADIDRKLEEIKCILIGHEMKFGECVIKSTPANTAPVIR